MNTTDKKKTSASDRLAAFIGFGIVRVQRKIAARLSSWERRCSALQKKVILVLFCIISAAYLGYVLIGALTVPRPATELPVPTQVVPQLSLPPPCSSDSVQSIIFFKSK